MRVGVIDYGVGNLGSMMRALEELSASPVIISRAVDLCTMDRFILPGVGNFSDCARLLIEGGWFEALRDEVQAKQKPLLGVCVGMQLLASCSMEGADAEMPNGIAGLGFIPGRVEHLRTLGCTMRVPHVGWNEITTCGASGGLFDGIPDGSDFYFVHSYAFEPDDPSDIQATTDYGIRVTAAIRRGHVHGTQFHPEKSSRAGFRFLQNFVGVSEC